MTVLSSKPKYPLYDRSQAFLNKTSPILLQNSTIQHLQELSHDMPVRSKAKHITYDDLIVELIKVYRKKRGLSDLWPSE